MKKLNFLLSVFCAITYLSSQKLPDRYHFTEDGHRLKRDISEEDNFFHDNSVDTMYFTFSQSNYATLLTNNYNSKTNIIVSLKYKNKIYDSVGIRYKGMTSYSGLGAQVKKKSYDVEMDWLKPNQDIKGYTNLNLNNWYADSSAMREVVYNYIAGDYIPNARAGFVVLYINGVNQGVYLNVQSLDKEHAKQNFMSDECTRWRAESPTSSGGFAGFGAGNSSLNNKGTDTAAYKSYYTLKKTYKAFPWKDLMLACNKMEALRNDFSNQAKLDTLAKYLDLDETLWMIASEIVNIDDDSYVYKGGMDYFVYYDVFSKKLLPIEYDGNSTFEGNLVTQWGLFYKETDTQFPLMNILFKVPQLRQRYLAHVRTILAEKYDNGVGKALVERYATMINPYLGNSVDNFSKAVVTTGINNLKNFFAKRSAYLKQNTELTVTGLTISNVSHSVNNVKWERPNESQAVSVTANVAGGAGVSVVYLYYGTQLDGGFQKLTMSGSGNTYSGTIPAQAKGTYVRYYIEAIANNSAKTATYEPVGAEHDVYIYQVKYAETVASNVVINEIVANNINMVADEAGAYGDWIEIFNKANTDQNMTGYALTDREATLAEWKMPDNTILPANGYLVIWADDKNVVNQNNIHSNFKLSSNGEKVYLVTPQGNIADVVEYGLNEDGKSYARLPNGTGAFTWKAHTFASDNSGITTAEENVAYLAHGIYVYPNPASEKIIIQTHTNGVEEVQIYNQSGALVHDALVQGPETIDIQSWNPGLYIIRWGKVSAKFVIK